MDDHWTIARGSQQLEGALRYSRDRRVDEWAGNYSHDQASFGGRAMSFTQTAIGGAFLAGLATLAIQTIAPEPQPIIVHSLTYRDGVVYQDRTVRADGPALYASWTAKVIDADTGRALPNCTGGGVWPYPVGRKEYDLPLAEWVGNDKCTPDTIEGHEVKLIAAWEWTGGSTSKESETLRP